MKSITLFLGFSIFFFGCEKDKSTSPQIIFKVGNNVVTVDTIHAAINSYQELKIEIINNVDAPSHYFMQLNNQASVDLKTTENLRMLKQSFGTGRNETSEFQITFYDTLYAENDIIRINVQVSELIKSINYLIIK